MTLPIGQIENYRKARTIYSSSNTRKLLKNEIRTEFSMRYGNRLKLHTSREHPYPGESSLLRTLPWEVDVLYQPNKELSQSRNNLQPGSYGYPIETGQFRITRTSRSKRLPPYCCVSLRVIIKQI